MNRKTLCGLLLLAGTLLSAGNVKPDPDSSPYGVCAATTFQMHNATSRATRFFIANTPLDNTR